LPKQIVRGHPPKPEESVHKEAIVIAVLNEGGKLVMESVIETKASSILQFIHGLRGELHVTWGRRHLGRLAV
jgi:hypothetical protein